MSLTFVSADGSVWPLDGSVGVRTINQDEGIFTIPTDLVVEQRVGSDGAVLVNIRRSPRRVSLHFLLEPTGATNLLTLWGQFFRSLSVGGSLVYEGPTGTRELRQIVLEGPDRSMTGQDLQFRTDDAYQVSLLALDPWWYGAAVQESFTFGEPTAWDAAIAWDSALPWNGGSAMLVTIQGDADALPLWTITGAVDELIVSNGVQSWTWVHTLASGDYGTVDHRPGTRSPRLGSGLNGVAESSFGLWFLLSNQSTLDWGLAPGENSLVVSVAGDDGSSALSMWYEPRYLVPG
jgi:hypothetical protein